MKLNTTPRHYMPLSQSQSDDDESGPCKEENGNILRFKNSFIASNELMKDNGHVEIYEVDAKNLPMTPLRRFSFILSLIVCVLFVLTFVFLVPCSKIGKLHSTCHIKKHWMIHWNMSFISPLDFVHSEILGNYLVIFGYSSNESGLIAIEGLTGKERWRLSLHSTPTSSICNVIDVNSDGYPECIVIGNNGLLTAVDLKTGTSLWYLHNHSDLHTVISIGKPMLMPDCDNDDVMDLFVPYLNIGDNVIYVALVSGGTGQIIGSFLELSQCIRPVTAQFTWKTQKDTEFVLYCESEDSNNLWFLSSKSICEVALNNSSRLVFESVYSIPKFAKDTHFYKVSVSDDYLAVVINGNEIMLLKKSAFTFSVVWKIFLENHHNIRILTDGHFSEGSNEIVILTSYLSMTKVMGINLIDGKEVWTMIQESENITLALKLPKFFGNSDGLILKIVSSLLLPDSTPNEEKFYIENNSSVSTEKKSRKGSRSITQFTENYVLVKPEKIPLVTNLDTEEIWSICEGNVCRPDVYTLNTTVLINVSKSEISVDVLALSSTLHLTNSSVFIKEEVSIKYWNLKKACYASRCTA